MLNNHHKELGLRSDDVMSIYTTDNVHWLLDCENNPWICRFNELKDMGRNMHFKLVTSLKPMIHIEEVTPTIFWMIDINQTVWQIYSDATNNYYPQFTLKHKFLVMSTYDNISLGLDEYGIIWEVNFQESQNMINFSEKYNLPKIDNIIATCINSQYDFEFFALDTEGNVWTQENSLSDETTTISKATILDMDEKVRQIYFYEDRLLLVTYTGNIYTYGSNRSTHFLLKHIPPSFNKPILTPFILRLPRSRQKSARK